MADQNNHEDRLADRNLRMIGRRLALPEEPTPQQQASWKQDPRVGRAHGPEQPSGRERRVRFARQRRFVALATSAMAAAVVLAVLLIAPQGSVVHASTILDSLRQALLNGFQIELRDLGRDGVHVDGRFVMTLKSPDGPLGAGGVLEPTSLRYESLYSNVRLWTDNSRNDEAGLDLHATVALSERGQWAYFKTSKLPRKLLEERPLGVAAVWADTQRRAVRV